MKSHQAPSVDGQRTFPSLNRTANFLVSTHCFAQPRGDIKHEIRVTARAAQQFLHHTVSGCLWRRAAPKRRDVGG